MNKNNYNVDYKSVTFLMLIGLCIAVIIFILMQNILYSSYLSYLSSCTKVDVNELTNGTYTMAGYVTTDENHTVTNYQIICPQPNVIRHELCHVAQANQHRDFNCKLPFMHFMSEVECYVIENIPFAMK